jgi:hypothetical protein
MADIRNQSQKEKKSLGFFLLAGGLLVLGLCYFLAYGGSGSIFLTLLFFLGMTAGVGGAVLLIAAYNKEGLESITVNQPSYHYRDPAMGDQENGECPNCDAVIPLSSRECPRCKSLFGQGSGWESRRI